MLSIMIVDDDTLSLKLLEQCCRLTGKGQIVGLYTSPLEALQYMQTNGGIDVALLDINMPEMNGLELGKALRAINPQLILGFVSAEKKYCASAMAMMADDFMLKPYSIDRLEWLMDKALLLQPRLYRAALRVRTFGQFEVWAHGKRVHFSNAKGRELLALCIDRNGEAVNMDEAMELLWPGEPMDERLQMRYRKAILDTRNALAPYGLRQVLETRRRCCRIIPEMMQCDYFDFIKGIADEHTSRFKEHLKEFSWAEQTIGKMHSLLC